MARTALSLSLRQVAKKMLAWPNIHQVVTVAFLHCQQQLFKGHLLSKQMVVQYSVYREVGVTHKAF